jgi:homospermidine synthase
MFGHVRSAVSGRCALRLARPLARRAAAARPLAAVNSAEGASSFRRCLSSYPSLATGGGDPAHVPDSVPATKLVDFEGKLVLLGLGSIGKGTLPLLLKHIGMDASQVYVLTADDMADAAAEVADVYGVSTTTGTLTRENFSELLDSTSGGMGKGDFIVNLTVDVSSCDLLEWCAERGVNYVDTVVEPWLGGYTDPSLTPAQRTNYALREKAMALKNKYGPDSPTAVITHGANPGMVSHFAKQALLNVSEKQNGVAPSTPTTREGWAELSQACGVRAIHIAERDTQVQDVPKKIGQFVNTWSIDGFIGEGCQPAELGWGTHEKALPPKVRRRLRWLLLLLLCTTAA